MPQLHLFNSTERSAEDRDCFLSGTPDIPDYQENITYTTHEELYPQIAKPVVAEVVELHPYREDIVA